MDVKRIKCEFNCSVCKKEFSNKFNLQRHMKAHKYCTKCDILTSNWSHHLRTNMHKTNAAEKLQPHLRMINQSFQNRIQTFLIDNVNEELINPREFLTNIKDDFVAVLQRSILNHQSFKMNVEFFAEYIKISANDEDDLQLSIKSFQTKMRIIINDEDINPAYDDAVEFITKKSEEFQEKDSGWALIRIVGVEININKYQPIRGSTYVKLPKSVEKKKACINVHNEDEFCFKWALISALKPVSSMPWNPSSYNINDISASSINLNNGKILKFGNILFPIKIDKISEFEKINIDISVNIFGLDLNKDYKYQVIGPYYLTKKEKQYHINLLLIEEANVYHFVYIKDLSRLIRTSLTSHKSRIFICNSCLQHFTNISNLEIHKDECGKIVSKLPDENSNILKYTNYQLQMKAPFVIYADCESILKSISTCAPNPDQSSTNNIKEHVPVAFGYFIKCSFDDKLNKYVECVGLNCAKEFILSLVQTCKDLFKAYYLKTIPMKPLTLDEELRQLTDEICHICGKNLDLENRIRDHCHFSGNYRGPAHHVCNLHFKKPNFFPVFFHNFSGYDCHLLFKALNYTSGNINIIPLNKEKYISLSKTIFLIEEGASFSIRFLDSFRFMDESLDSLFTNLDIRKKLHVKQYFADNSNLITKKGVFPYEYLDDWSKLHESLPPQIAFYNQLTKTLCSDADYNHALLVWQTFKCKNMLDYLKIYLKTDVLILTDVFESFRDICKTVYDLDPANFYTAPGLSWQAMLKYTNIELELFTDINMFNFIKKGMRGGISQCSLRHSLANNKYMKEKFDSEQPAQYIIYLDAVNLYGYAMSQYLPYKNFKWIENSLVTNYDVNNISDNSSLGYILEVDLEYPDYLHELHNDLPFCSKKETPPNKKLCKLLTTLENKSKYVIHYKNLKQCLKNGLILRKIHRILEFEQSDWLKKYIDLNTFHRQNAKNDFDKKFFKKQNNAVYGKTMENVEKYREIKIVDSWENKYRHLGARAYIAKPNFHSLTVFTNNLIAIELEKTKIFYNKPIYAGFCILELSKVLMYNFHYDYIKSKFQSNAQLNYMDTDSFVYTIQTEDFYKTIRPDLNKYFDTSDYEINNPYNFPSVNKKVLGMFKDEMSGKIITEFIGLRSKMYSIKTLTNDTIKKSKGVKKFVIDNLDIDDYRNCLKNKKILYRNMQVFKSKLHTIYTQELNKIALSYLDDKKYILPDNVKTYSWGHKNINVNTI